MEKLIIKPEIKAVLKDVEVVVFDVDGVLIDVSGSFRKTIVDTIQFFFQNILKYSGDEALVRPGEIALFKEAGGFNNDWELTEAIGLFYLCKSFLLDSKDLAIMRFQEPYLDSFVVSSVKSFQEAALSLLNEKEKKAVLGLWNKALMRQVFQEMYAGSKYCKKFYGFEPTYFKGEGSIKKEVVLLDNSLIKKPVAVVTGRAEEEAKAAIEFTGLEVAKELVVSDDGRFERKPSAHALAYISDKMSVELGVYIGDTRDDYEMVANFNNLGGSRRFISAIVTEESENFKEADIVASNVNEVLRSINSSLRWGEGR